jgi:pimeloyl-ACP methyl ester carboxylesterase
MAQVKSSSVTVAGHPCRVLEAGAGSPVVYLAGIGGLPKWSPFLDALSTTHRVIAPSLPGFPGAPDFRHLDDYHEWVVATLELLEALREAPVDVVASSVSAPLSAEVAGLAPERVRRLVLVAPFGMYDDTDPTTDIWAQRPGPDVLPALLCNSPEIGRVCGKFRPAKTPSNGESI